MRQAPYWFNIVDFSISQAESRIDTIARDRRWVVSQRCVACLNVPRRRLAGTLPLLLPRRGGGLARRQMVARITTMR
jgi:hypothetical protein